MLFEAEISNSKNFNASYTVGNLNFQKKLDFFPQKHKNRLKNSNNFKFMIKCDNKFYDFDRESPFKSIDLNQNHIHTFIQPKGERNQMVSKQAKN